VDQVDIYFHYLSRLKNSWNGLADKPLETLETTLRTLWFLAKGDRRSIERSLFAELPDLVEAELELLDHLLQKRLSGIPLAHLTGRQNFIGIEMLVGPEAMIPRKETELLGYAALTRLRQMIQKRNSVRVIDLCTGGGNLALALAQYERNCEVYGADISGEAIELAQRNAHFLGLEDRVRFLVGDLLETFEGDDEIGKADMIICNPPYISTSKVNEMAEEISNHEPTDAFDGGAFGISILMRVIKDGPNYLKPSSWLGFEVGVGQGDSMKRRVDRHELFELVQVETDEQDQIRVIFGLTKN